MRIAGDAKWVTVPRKHSGNATLISEIEIENVPRWRKKFLGTLRANYGKSKFFSVIFPQVEAWLDSEESLLSRRNVFMIRCILRELAITTKTVLYSEIGEFKKASFESDHPDSAGSARLVNIVKHLEGTVYLAGDGADGYEQVELYKEAGLSLKKLGFQHPTYPQGADPFVPGLSILDPLFHLGFEGTQDLLKRSPEQDAEVSRV